MFMIHSFTPFKKIMDSIGGALNGEASALWPVYFLHGEDLFKIKVFLQFLKSRSAVEVYDGEIHSVEEIQEGLQTVSLFLIQNKIKCVYIKNSDALKKPEFIVEPLIKSEQPYAETILVMQSSTLDLRRKFHQWVKRKKYTLDMGKPNREECELWLSWIAQEKKVSIPLDAREFLLESCDGQLWNIDQEIEKASLYAEDSAVSCSNNLKQLTLEHFYAVSSSSRSQTMLTLIKAILENKRIRALHLSQKLIQSTEEAMNFVGLFSWALRNLEKISCPISFEKQKKLLADLLILDSKLKSISLDALFLIERFILDQTSTFKPSIQVFKS